MERKKGHKQKWGRDGRDQIRGFLLEVELVVNIKLLESGFRQQKENDIISSEELILYVFARGVKYAFLKNCLLRYISSYIKWVLCLDKCV